MRRLLVLLTALTLWASPAFGGSFVTTSSDLDNVYGVLDLPSGGTGANLTAAQGGLVYSGASSLAIQSAGTSGYFARSGGTGAPTWFDLFAQPNTWTALQTFGAGLTVSGGNLIAPTLIGGTGTTSTLTLQSTSGVGASGADIVFKVGNNGATEAGRILNSGYWGIGVSPEALLHTKSTTNVGQTGGILVENTSNGASAYAQTTWRNDAGTRFSFLLGGSGTAFANVSLLWAIDNYDMAFGTNSTERLRITNAGNVGIGTTGPDRLLHPELADAVTAAVSHAQRLSHISSGTVADGFGVGLEFELEGATGGTNYVAGSIESRWITATDVGRRGRVDIYANDTSPRLGLSVATSGSATQLSFFGVSPVDRVAALTQTYATADRTHANLTSADLGAFTGGTVGFLDAAERDNVRTQVNALRADLADLKQFVNSLVDDMQAYGLEQ